MENRHVTQALQEILSDLPLEEQALKISSFAERIKALEAVEPKHVDSGVQQGWEGIGEYETDEVPGLQERRHQNPRKGKRAAARETKVPPLAAFLAPVVLALVEAVIIVALLISGGGRPVETDDADRASAGPDSEYVEPAENGEGSEDNPAPERDPASADSPGTDPSKRN